MRGYKLRVVVVYEQVSSSANHCDNSCQHMSHPPISDQYGGARCDLFDVGLVWDKRKKKHGYKRCADCLKAEDAAEEMGL